MNENIEASSNPARRLGSYSTAKVSRGRVERLERHATRLRRDARRLGLPVPDRREIERTFLEAAAESFAGADGIVRIEWSHLPGEAPKLIASPRVYASLPAAWRAATSSVVHPGREFRANTKYVDVDAYDRSREDVANSDYDEVLLFDAGGNLVEGSQSNCLAVLADGRLITPTLEAGGVEGIGLAIVRDDYPELYETWIPGESLDDAHELMSVNTVRGVVPIVELDGKAIGAGVAGPWAIRLAAIFARH